MRRLVEFALEDGGTVLVQVEEDPGFGGGVTRGLGERRVFEQAQHSFEQAVGRVQPAVQAMLDRLRASTDPPDEVQVEFGVELSAAAGAFIAAATSTGNFRVSMTWRSRRAQPGEREAPRGS